MPTFVHHTTAVCNSNNAFAHGYRRLHQIVIVPSTKNILRFCPDSRIPHGFGQSEQALFPPIARLLDALAFRGQQHCMYRRQKPLSTPPVYLRAWHRERNHGDGPAHRTRYPSGRGSSTSPL